ncbi:STAS domain protein [Planctomycetes bacterium MalM25]|nr:STAS domain protein [Planctomycetes bacterium MalM25]
MIKASNQGAVLVLDVAGPLNQEEADRLRGQIDSLPRVGRPQVVIDLAEVPLIDSAGCEALLDAREAVTADGGGVHLAGVSPLCHDILEATGVLRYFSVFDGEKQAVAQFAR